jgi:hypothetical protein
MCAYFDCAYFDFVVFSLTIDDIHFSFGKIIIKDVSTIRVECLYSGMFNLRYFCFNDPFNDKHNATTVVKILQCTVHREKKWYTCERTVYRYRTW